MTLYVDGCSYAYGDGLDRKYSLSNLIGGDVDKSYGGKNNQSILHDLYLNIDKHDTFVISMSYSDRFVLFDSDTRIPILPSLESGLGRIAGTAYEQPYKGYHKILYTLYDKEFYSKLSDATADSMILLLDSFKKKFVIFTWERRKNFFNNRFTTMSFSKDQYLSDGHLNEKGMQRWADITKEALNDI